MGFSAFSSVTLDNEAVRGELRAFLEGWSCEAYRVLGAHRVWENEWLFRVYAPNAKNVCLVGDFNGWQGEQMQFVQEFGVWETRRRCTQGDRYKYAVTGADSWTKLKSDPFSVRNELRPGSASVVWDFNFENRCGGERRLDFKKPVSIYEVHLGSWEKGLTFTGASSALVDYAADMGYTAIELMPITEHLLDDCWGYQSSGMYAITARYGTPQELRTFVERAHKKGLAVVIDWVPAHFVKDDCGLRLFDGTPLFESADPLRAEMPLWGTLLYDYDKPIVRSYLLSNALYLIENFGIDGIRVDAVSAMLYLDFCKGEWRPNFDGSNRNYAAENFIKQLNARVHERTNAVMIAEESSAYPHVTGSEGLDFDYKWNMGFMNDTLTYFEYDSVYRKYHHDKLTFPMAYAFAERYVLPFSHDEVVYGKHSLIGRMAGNYEAQFAQLRLLLAYRMCFPGKKLEFMGSEFGQYNEWNFRKSLEWFLLDYKEHRSMQSFAKAVNFFYREHTALHNDISAWEGYRWLACDDAEHSIISFRRRNPDTGEALICVFNFTPGEHGYYGISLDAIKDEIGDLPNIPCVFSTHNRGGMRAEIRDGMMFLPIYGYEGAIYQLKTDN